MRSRFFAWRGHNRNGFTHTSGVQVLSIAGTQGRALNDILADLRLVIQLMPRPASSALEYSHSVITDPANAIVVGHSLRPRDADDT